MLAVVLALAAVSAWACDEPPTATPAPVPIATPTLTYDLEAARAELATARALWESRGSNDYTVEYEALLWLAEIPTRLTIRDGVITSAVYLTESKYGAPVEPRVWYGLRTIDGAFSEIESAVTFRPVFYMSAAYDPYYGFPIDFDITYINEADNHFSGGFSNYQPLSPEPSGVDPDERLNEILLIDDASTNIKVGVFQEISMRVGPGW